MLKYILLNNFIAAITQNLDQKYIFFRESILLLRLFRNSRMLVKSQQTFCWFYYCFKIICRQCAPSLPAVPGTDHSHHLTIGMRLSWNLYFEKKKCMDEFSFWHAPLPHNALGSSLSSIATSFIVAWCQDDQGRMCVMCAQRSKRRRFSNMECTTQCS